MFNIFKSKNKLDKKSNDSLNNLANSINNQSQNKENLEDFILILQQIQEVNNNNGEGKGSVMKNYKAQKTYINNIIDLSIEKMQQKIVKLDNTTIQNH